MKCEICGLEMTYIDTSYDMDYSEGYYACPFVMNEAEDVVKKFHNILDHEKYSALLKSRDVFQYELWANEGELANQLDDYENALMNAHIPPVNAKNRLPAEIRSIIGAF